MKPSQAVREYLQEIGSRGKGAAKVRGDSGYYSAIACKRWKVKEKRNKIRETAREILGLPKE